MPNDEWPGWWAKMNLFSPELKQLRPFLYLDLDTVVLQSLKDLVPPKDKQDKFVMLRDFYRPTQMASGLMWVPDTVLIDEVYKQWIKRPKTNIKKYKGDQNFISSVVKGKGPDLFWQDISKPNYITTFKPFNAKKRPEWRTEFPANSAVVCFHGKPRIPEAANTVDWVKDYVSYAI